MVQRIAAGLVLVSLLASLLIYSQLRQEVPKASGVIEADEIRVGSRVGGRVAEVRVQEGARVKPGDILVVLDEFDLRERIAGAEANLAAKRAEFEKLKGGFRTEEVAQAKARQDAAAATLKKLIDGPRTEEIETARANFELAKSQQERASLTLERAQTLHRSRSISQEDLDRAVEEMKVSSALVQARHQELKLLEKGTREEDILVARANHEEATQAYELAVKGYRAEDIAQAEAAMQSAQSALDALHVQQSELSIKADVDGLVSALELRPGDLVPANGPVLSLLDVTRLWVRAYIPQSRVGLQVGQRLRITVDGASRDYQGEITYISPQAEFTPRNVQTPEERAKQVFRMKVHLPVDTSDLRPGMTVDVWLTKLEQ